MTDQPIAGSAGLPTTDRAWQLAELAYPDGGVKVIGWTDNSVVLDEPQTSRWDHLTFTVTKELERPQRQEDSVLIIAVRVPHPDEMSLAEVIGQSTR